MIISKKYHFCSLNFGYVLYTVKYRIHRPFFFPGGLLRPVRHRPPIPPPPPLHWYLYSNQIWLTYRAIIFMVYYKSSITINRPIKTSYLCCTIARSKPSDGSALPKPAAALFNVTQYFSANRPRNRIMRSCIHAQAPCSGLLT